MTLNIGNYCVDILTNTRLFTRIHRYLTIPEVTLPGSEFFVISFRVVFVLERQIHSCD